jgi:threonyl-tRNA synthetase
VDEQTGDINIIRHSLAHIMANAIQNKWPDVKFGVGPAIDNGFYYDIDLGDNTISEEDFTALEQEMRVIIKADQSFERIEMPIEQAIIWAQDNDQPYKLELLNDLKRSGTTLAKDLDPDELGTIADGDSAVVTVSFYKNGNFIDLCRGPHVKSTGKVGSFKLDKISGVYWRGNENNKQMQRLYGLGFATDKELIGYLIAKEEAQKRDHRRLGQELDLFVISPLVGPGLPLFTPRGTVLRNELIKFSEELQKNAGYEAVWAPHISRTELYLKSGHYDKYPERFEVTSTESDDTFMMKPMNCPHVAQIFASRPRSYRDMPQRYMETTTMYRDEKSGELHGLSRVRALTQDDSHAFVRHDQIENEVKNIVGMIKQMYLTLNLKLSVELSFRDDKDSYFGEIKVWESAQAILEKIAIDEELDYKIILGEAAFYGPKIDIYISDALNRRWQCATVQLDYVQPERFELGYIDEQGKEQRPAMIHKAILGSIERFLSVYIEHTAGRFPVWLSPEQIRLITVNQEEPITQFAEKISQQAKAFGLRLTVDNSNESVGKKIRAAELYKVPYTLVIGEKEIQSGEVSPRIRKDMAVVDVSISIGIEEFLKTVVNESKSRVLKTSL